MVLKYILEERFIRMTALALSLYSSENICSRLWVRTDFSTVKFL